MRTHLVLQATSLKCPSLHLWHLGRLHDLHPRTLLSHPQTWPVLRPQARVLPAYLVGSGVQEEEEAGVGGVLRPDGKRQVSESIVGSASPAKAE
ncbi:unnamed protein product [Rangifer tarandus platyrhynchus]|uniref:Uncharacterized protein n=2 Tax=Rangifer tarandus platyrhynchus TaxID=3082113 RepID=A0ABN9A0E6_RANTA|nr:unnamed protein product [Rangifer tarandus platyrhynchus]CAI9712327.1 unnamed protein product [Rangifer tarandus platyrhynchus]